MGRCPTHEPLLKSPRHASARVAWQLCTGLFYRSEAQQSPIRPIKPNRPNEPMKARVGSHR